MKNKPCSGYFPTMDEKMRTKVLKDFLKKIRGNEGMGEGEAFRESYAAVVPAGMPVGTSGDAHDMLLCSGRSCGGRLLRLLHPEGRDRRCGHRRRYRPQYRLVPVDDH